MLKRLLAMFFLVSLLGALGGCWLNPLPLEINVFFDAVKNTAPVFDSPGSKTMSKAVWGNPAGLGHPIYEIFLKFRYYDPIIDTGAIGLENIFKLTYQAGQLYNESEQGGGAIADTVMQSPFDFNRTDNVYNKVLIDESLTTGVNYLATKKDGKLNYGLLSSYKIVDTNTKSYTIMQGKYDEATGDIDIDLVCFVSSTSSQYSLRTHLEGNAVTHGFSKLLTGAWNTSTVGPGYRAWYVGTGYSKGAGKSFLFKVTDNGVPGVAGKYFGFPADASEATLRTFNDAGSSTTSLGAYKVIVDGMVAANDYFDVIMDSPTEVPTKEADFHGAGIGNMKPVGMP